MAGEIKPGRVPLAATGPILLTGASGYVGGRLLSALEHDGHRVRCLARRPEMLPTRADSATQVVAGDVLDRTSLDAALEGIETAYYLVHSMGSTGSFEDADRQAARNFADAAQAAGVRRIVYLGGLGDDRGALSPHLRSRQEVGQLLARGGRAGAGVPRIDRHRVGQPVVRDGPLARGAAAHR